MSFSLGILLMINKIPLHGPLCFRSQGWSLVFQLAAWLQSVFDRHGHAQGLLQIVYCQNETLSLSEGALLSNSEISAGDQTTVAMGDPLCISALSSCVRRAFPCVCVCVCEKWVIWCEDTKPCLHLSPGLDAALKVKVQTLEPGSWLMGREQLAASRHTTPRRREGARLSGRLDLLFTGSLLISMSCSEYALSQDRREGFGATVIVDRFACYHYLPQFRVKIQDPKNTVDKFNHSPTPSEQGSVLFIYSLILLRHFKYKINHI